MEVLPPSIFLVSMEGIREQLRSEDEGGKAVSLMRQSGEKVEHNSQT